MNEIKEDLGIAELEWTEFLMYSFIIFKRNFFNFLPLIIAMILLKIFNFYQADRAYKFSGSKYGAEVYKIFTDLNIGWIIDEGLGEEAMILGLYLRFIQFAGFIESFFYGLLFPGLVISVCKYIDHNVKTNPLSETGKVIFRISKLMIISLLLGLILGAAVTIVPIRLIQDNTFINIIINIFLLFMIMKCLYFAQEYFYQKNSIIKSIKNSLLYSDFEIEAGGFVIAVVLFILEAVISYFFREISIILSTSIWIYIIIMITLF